jgi:hypothetical protein
MSFLAKLIPVLRQSASSVLLADGTTGSALSDAKKLMVPAHGLHFLAAGLVTVIDEDGNSSQILGVAGQDYGAQIVQIMATGTAVSAANLVLLRGI